MRGRLIAIRRLRLKTTQYDFLQPRRNAGPPNAGRYWVEPESIPQSRHGLRDAERQFPGRHFVEHHTEREQVTARIGACVQNLLGRDIRSRSGSEAPLLGQQIRIAGVMSETEIDQAYAAIRPENRVVRLQVEMNRILQVQAL